jgi:hypothetical protein
VCTQVRSGLSESQRKELGSGGADQWWHISYVGEHGSDAGGLFRDSLSALAAELLRGAESGAAGSGADFRGGSVGGGGGGSGGGGGGGEGEAGRSAVFECPLFVRTEVFITDEAGMQQLAQVKN